MNFDVELYGNCDDVIAELCLQLGSEWTGVLQGFTPNTLDHERWKMFYDYCESIDSANEDDQNQKPSSETELTLDSDKDSNYNSKSVSGCKCGLADNEDNGIEVGEKRKVRCSCVTIGAENGSSPNKQNRESIHTDQGKLEETFFSGFFFNSFF